jgi:nucleotide-binding universal stress UspA family protein
MNVLVYVGPAPSREQLLPYCAPIVQTLASTVCLLVPEGTKNEELFQQALDILQIPSHIPITKISRAGNAQNAILTAVSERLYDLVIMGHLERPLRRFWPIGRSDALAQEIEPSVLRVQGELRPIRSILLASGGNEHTMLDAKMAQRFAQALGAKVTLLHVMSQQAVVFEGIPNAKADKPLLSTPPHTEELDMLNKAQAWLCEQQIESTVKVRYGAVMNEVLEEIQAGPHDLLVSGAHLAYSILDRLLIEDISSGLLAASPVPVVIVRGTRRIP